MLFLLLLLKIELFASVVIDGICYELNESTKTAVVTYLSVRNNSYAGDIEIPSSVTYKDISYSVVKIGYIAFANCTNLVSVSIPSSVTTIGESAFYNCTGLKTLTLPASVTEIDDTALKYCTALKTFVIPNGTTTVGSGAFYGCTALESVVIPNSITTLTSNAFEGCSNLKTVTLDNQLLASTNRTTKFSLTDIFGSQVEKYILGEHVTSIGDYAFYSAKGMTSVSFSDNLGSIGESAFYVCTSLKDLVLPSRFSVMHKGAFYKCTSLESVKIPNSLVYVDGGAFGECPNLRKVIIDDIYSWCKIVFVNNYSNPLCFGAQLYDSSEKPITSIQIPKGVTEIGYYQFYNCSGLTSITFPSTLETIGLYAFHGCADLTSIVISHGLKTVKNYAFSNCTSLKWISFPTSVEEIGESVFAGCTSLLNVSLPDNLKIISRNLFSGCTALSDMTIPTGTTQVYNDAFDGCDNLKELTVKCPEVGQNWFVNLNIESVYLDNVVKVASKAFSNCQKLNYLRVGEAVKDINDNAFEGCAIKTVDFKCDSIGAWYKNYPLLQKVKMTFTTLPITAPGGGSIPSRSYSLVRVVGSNAFKNCTLLETIDIPNTVESIGDEAFYGCTGLQTVSLQESLKTIGHSAFYGCEKIAAITIPESVKKLGNKVFYGCKNLTTIDLPSGLEELNAYTFYGCTSLTTLTLPEHLKVIGNSVFQNCSSLETLTFPNSVTTIGSKAFGNCSSITSVVIPENTENIGDDAFTGCTNLTEVTINSNTIVSKNRTRTWDSKKGVYTYNTLRTIFGEQVLSYIIGNPVETIGSNAFAGCKNMTSITFPSSLKTVGYCAFAECTGLTKVIIHDLTAWCNINYYRSNDFMGSPLYFAHHIYSDEDTEITELVIPEGVAGIGNMAFINCENIISVSLPNSVASIGYYAFANCTSLATITIPNSVTKIYGYAFSGCTNFTKLILPDNITYVENTTFDSSMKLYVNKGTNTLLTLWNAGYNPYLLDTGQQVLPPYLTVEDITQSTATVIINNLCEGFNYYNGNTRELISGSEMKLTGLAPELAQNVYVSVSTDDFFSACLRLTVNFTTLPITPSIVVKKTATSVVVSVSYVEGDAEVTSQRLVMNPSSVSSSKIYGGTDLDGLVYTATGLEPNSVIGNFVYELYANGRRYCTAKTEVRTDALTLTTEQPKVISVGNVIVSAQSNIDDAEENVGFEWRRTDWTDEFASNSGKAYLYEGEMEGYIRNLYTEKLWKYRPYYTSAAGNSYYGEWVGIDPTNTSYFEPTLHTYAAVDVTTFSANLKGLALPGSDNILERGFEYWIDNTVSASPGHRVPKNHMTVIATGTQMTAAVEGLDPETTYRYCAYAKTDEGTTYGEEKTFTTLKDDSFILGDVNGDGSVTITDAVAIVNDIFGNRGERFIEAAADVNGDKKITISDAVGVVKIIQSAK